VRSSSLFISLLLLLVSLLRLSRSHITTVMEQPTTSIHETGSGVIVEVRAADGSLVCEYEASKEEAGVAAVLLQARSELAAQRPLRAFELVVDAIRRTRGEAAILDVIDEAKRAHEYMLEQQQRHSSSMDSSSSMATDDDSYHHHHGAYDDGYYDDDAYTSSLSTEHTQPAYSNALRAIMTGADGADGYSTSTSSSTSADLMDQQAPDSSHAGGAAAAATSDDDGAHEALLCEQGRMDVLQDAYFDGSSVLCPNCHGLVSRKRFDAHVALWCPALS